MDGGADLPDGPSGRNPIKAIEIKDTDLMDRESLLVLFNDGTLGTWSKKGDLSSDGSEYSMIFYSTEQFGKIDTSKNEMKKESLFLYFLLFINLISILLYFYVRTYSEWPSLISTVDDFISFFLVLPALLFWWMVSDLLNYSDGEIIVHLKDTDPHVFPVLSKSYSTVRTIIGDILVIGLLTIYSVDNGSLVTDILILILTLMPILNYFFVKPIGNINDFYSSITELHDEIRKQNRIGNQLIDLLMDNESPKLEFKASLWGTYHGVSGKLVEEQEEKNLKLEDSVLKTVAGFLNTDGGTLLIGIKDKPRDSGDKVAEVLGIEPDFKWLKKGKRDPEGYTHVLFELFKNSLTNPVANQHINLDFPVYQGQIICRVDVQPLPRILGQQCFADTKTMNGKKLFVRSADSTIAYSIETQYDYIRHHFEGYEDKKS